MSKRTRKPGPVAVVTGAGRGIGRSIAIELAREGFDIAGIDIVFEPRNKEKGLFEVRKQVTGLGRRFLPLGADIADISGHELILDTTPESWDRLMSVNARGAFFLTQKAARRMIGRTEAEAGVVPCIIFITSISALVSSTTRAEYCMSKAALSMAATLFAHALAPLGIAVYEVRPGVIATDMTTGVKKKYDRLIAQGLIPQGRWGRPEDVGRAVAALARGAFAYSTGPSSRSAEG